VSPRVHPARPSRAPATASLRVHPSGPLRASEARRWFGSLPAVVLSLLLFGGCGGAAASGGEAPGPAVGAAGGAGSGGASALPAGVPALDEPGRNLLVVCVQDEAQVAIVDMDTHEVVHRIELTELGYSERAQPHHAVVEPDGSHFYVTLIGENRVLKFDRTYQVVGEAPMQAAGMLALEKGGDRLFVSRSMSAVNPPQRIGIVMRSTMEIEELDIFFAQPHAMVVDAEGRYAYTASLGVNQAASVNLETERVTLVELEGPNHAIVQFAISPDGRWMAGSGEMSGELVILDLAADRAHPPVVRRVPVGHMAFDPTFSPDGRQVWVPVKHTDEVVVLETEGWQEVRRISGSGMDAPHQVVFSHDGTRAFISNNNKNPHAMHGPVEDDGGDGAVVVVDTASGEIVEVVRLGRNVTGIGTRPRMP
jgi:DNA-binding beta-propeller fold protein YncE